MASQKDAELAEARNNGKMGSLPMLHGIPFSVTDQINMTGKQSTIGCAYLSDNAATSNAAVVKLMLGAGGIPLVRGNCPQMGLGLNSKNLIWNQTRNPFDSSRSCNGSSGGDVALVSMRCVPFYIGIDITSSMRISSSFVAFLHLHQLKIYSQAKVSL